MNRGSLLLCLSIFSATLFFCGSTAHSSGCQCLCRTSNQCWTWCGPSPWSCKTHTDGKTLTGLCSIWNILSPEGLDSSPRGGINLPVADALELWLLAFEAAGMAGGGPPDPALVAQAEAVPLPASVAPTVRKVALQVQVDYLGLVEDGGLYDPPPLNANCQEVPPHGQNGFVGPFGPCLNTVSTKIREGMVGELRTPGTGVLDARFAEIPVLCPGYLTRGRCTFPPPDGVPLPYPNGLTCLREECRAPITALFYAIGGTDVPVVAPNPTSTTSVSVFPNPATEAMTISLEVKSAGEMLVDVVDLSGRLVATLLDESVSAGKRDIVWNGRDGHGELIVSGVYYVRARSASGEAAQKLVMVR